MRTYGFCLFVCLPISKILNHLFLLFTRISFFCHCFIALYLHNSSQFLLKKIKSVSCAFRCLNSERATHNTNIRSPSVILSVRMARPAATCFTLSLVLITYLYLFNADYPLPFRFPIFQHWHEEQTHSSFKIAPFPPLESSIFW